MKKTLMLLALVSVMVVGCKQWAKVESFFNKTKTVAENGEKLAVVTSPWAMGYGSAIGTVLSGIVVISKAMSALAKEKKKTNAVAKASVEAADKVVKGGIALVSAAQANGVAHIIKSAEVQFADKG